MVVLRERLHKFRLCVLHTVSLILTSRMNNLTSNETPKPLTDNHMHPFDLAENLAVLDDIFICDQQDLEVLNWPVLSSPCKLRRCVALPLYKIIFTDSAHFANSPNQLIIVDSGTMTR